MRRTFPRLCFGEIRPLREIHFPLIGADSARADLALIFLFDLRQSALYLNLRKSAGTLIHVQINKPILRSRAG